MKNLSREVYKQRKTEGMEMKDIKVLIQEVQFLVGVCIFVSGSLKIPVLDIGKKFLHQRVTISLNSKFFIKKI